MTENLVNEGMARMLQADNEVGRCLAMDELLERLLRAAGRRQDKIGPIVAALLLLWRGDHSSPEHMERARQRALAALKTAGLDVRHLTMLATCGRLLLDTAIELQGEILLATPEAAEYVPQENDLAVWLGKHVVKVVSVERITIADDHGPEEHVDHVSARTASGRVIPINPKELELYHREPADYEPVESDLS